MPRQGDGCCRSETLCYHKTLLSLVSPRVVRCVLSLHVRAGHNAGALGLCVQKNGLIRCANCNLDSWMCN
jgi:hypothetical protein